MTQHELWCRANFRARHGKTKVWNRAGVEPGGCEELTIAARGPGPSFGRAGGPSVDVADSTSGRREIILGEEDGRA